MASRRDAYISKTLKCLISLNLLKKKKKGAKCNNFQRNLKKNFKEILVLKILRLLIALKHSFKSFKGQKALFKPFNVFLMQKCILTKKAREAVLAQSTKWVRPGEPAAPVMPLRLISVSRAFVSSLLTIC